jgi:hypothetical protein
MEGVVLIAIDFDDTLTADTKLWWAFTCFAKALNHRVVCVTARRDTSENREIVSEWMQDNGIELQVYYSSLGSKVDYMKGRGLDVDIWIDDDPRKCALGH